MKLNFPTWLDLPAAPFAPDGPTIAGVSGGRTSAMMAALMERASPGATVFTFQNTGLEAPGTYDFLMRLEDALERPIIWLEYRPPADVSTLCAKAGSAFEVVTPATASRRGEPFIQFFRDLTEFRRRRGKGPIGPHPRQRTCTSYLKIRVAWAYAISLFPDGYGAAIGLRADEPRRVAGLEVRRNRFPEEDPWAPLAQAGVVKADVLRFWQEQSFDLMLREHEGNCTKCFLKSESELADSFTEYPADSDVWIGMEAEFGIFGKHGLPYATIAAEAPIRRGLIRPMVRAGLEPSAPEGFDSHRFRLLIFQERRRAQGESATFSCACEAAAGVDLEYDP